MVPVSSKSPKISTPLALRSTAIMLARPIDPGMFQEEGTVVYARWVRNLVARSPRQVAWRNA
eukprot:8504956-Pyramimonas_sp.AAC.1